MLAELRAEAMAGFDFEQTVQRMEREREALLKQFPMRIQARTPNQLLLPDGRLVEGDAALYVPGVVAERASDMFSDWPD